MHMYSLSISHLETQAFSILLHYNGHGMQMSLWDGFSFLWSSQNRAARLYTAPLYISVGPSKLSAPVASPVSRPANCKLGPHFLFFGCSDRNHAKETPFRLFVHFPTSTLAVSHSLRHTQNNSDFESFAFVVPSASLPPRQAPSFPFRSQIDCPSTRKASLIILPWLALISILSSPLEHLQK